MSWVAFVCPAIAAACVTLAGVHLTIWVRDRTSVANLGYAMLAFGVAWFTCAETALMYTATAAEVGRAFQWIHGAVFTMVLGMTLFVRFYFRTRRPWLGYGAVTVWSGMLALSLSRPTSADYDVIQGIVQRSFLGQTVSVPVGRTSVGHWFGQVGFVLLVSFFVDALWTTWREGSPLERRRAASVGAATAVFAVLGPVWAGLIFAGVVEWPHVEFLLFVPAVLVMAHELGDDVLRAARLTGLLQASERAARELSGRLINAQEDERRRIARELHDDLSQRLALLSIEVDLLGSAHAREAGQRIPQIASAVKDVASEVHRLAYQLHPAKLDQLGLVTAARSWCRDFARQTGLAIEVVADDVPRELPPAVALCLYRVVQESLQNVARHSGSRDARVRLTHQGAGLHLVITDSGRGFDPSTADSGGLGLVSMRERVRLLNGSIAVRSRPGAGTVIDMTVPVPVPTGAGSLAG